MEKLSKKENGLIKSFEKEFFDITGRRVRVIVLSKVDALSFLPFEIDMSIAFGCLCEGMNWDFMKVLSPQKRPDPVLKREVLYNLFYYNGFNLSTIAKFFLDKNHTTIMYSLEKTKTRVEDSSQTFFAPFLRECRNYLEENYQTFKQRVEVSDIYSKFAEARSFSERNKIIKERLLDVISSDYEEILKRVEYAFKLAKATPNKSNAMWRENLKKYLICMGIV